MKILIDIVHPAHVYFFRQAIDIWQRRGHEVLVTSRDKDIAIRLLELHHIEHTKISDCGRGALGMGYELVRRDIKLLKIARRFRPDIMVGIAGFSIAMVGWWLGIPRIILTDTEDASLSNAISFPFASLVCTPASYTRDAGPKHLRYNGFHELAYLHPNNFTPQPEVPAQSGISPEEKYILVRLVSWGALHDRGEQGIKSNIEFVQELEKLGRVVITSEKPLPPELEKNRIRVSPEKIHHLLYFAQMYIGESPTMASEAGMLGTPAVLISSWAHRAGCIMEQCRYGVVHAFTDQTAALKTAMELWQQPELKAQWREKSRIMLSEKIEVTPWLVELVENHGR